MKQLNIIFLVLFSVGFLVRANAQLIVKLDSPKKLQNLLPKADLIELFPFSKHSKLKNVYQVKLPSLYDPISARAFVMSNMKTEYVDIDTYSEVFNVRPSSNQGKNYFPYQWALENKKQSIEIRDSIELSYSSNGQEGADINYEYLRENVSPYIERSTVAVLDSGVFVDHKDLFGRIKKNPEACEAKFAGGLIAPEPSEENPFPWDCEGYNFAALLYRDQVDVTDVYGHGTHISGILAANDNDFGVVGISDKIDILPVKVFLDLEEYPTDDSGDASYKIGALSSNVARGLHYSIYKNVDVVNLSLGWPPILDLQVIKDLIKIAREQNIAVVAASGNDSSFSQVKPCAYENVICVGATDNQNRVANFSNFGSHVDFFAPGLFILSTFPENKSLIFHTQDYEYMTGSSQAAPFIAGIIAMAKTYFPSLSIREVKERMFATASSAYPFGNSFFPNVEKLFDKTYLPKIVYPEIKDSPGVVFSEMGLGSYVFKVKANSVVNAESVSIEISNLSQEFYHTQTDCESVGPRDLSCSLEFKTNFNKAHHLMSFDLVVKSSGMISRKLAVKLHAQRKFVPNKGIPLGKIKLADSEIPKSSEEIKRIESEVLTSISLKSPVPALSLLQSDVYYLIRNNEVDFYSLSNSDLLFSRHFETNEEVFAVYSGDFNYDKKEDYLLVIGTYVDDEKEQVKSLDYYYIDSLGKDLFNSKSRFVLENSAIGINVLNQSTTQWRKLSNKGESIAVPVFWSQRNLVKDTSLPKIYGAQTNSKQAILSFTIKTRSDGLHSFTPVILDNKRFYLNERRKLAEHLSDNFLVSSSLVQGLSDYYNSEVNYLVLTGQGTLARSYLYSFKSDLSYSKKSLKQNVLSRIGSRTNPVINIETGNVDSHNFFFSTDYLNSMASLSIADLDWSLSEFSKLPDSPSFGAIVSYVDSTNDIKHLSFNNKFLYLRKHGQKKELTKKDLLKNTLVPFTGLAQSYFPVVTGKKTERKMRIFVEESFIEGNQAHFLTIENDSIKSYLKHKFSIPSNCSVENTGYSEENGSVAVVLLCSEYLPDSKELSYKLHWNWID